MKKTQPNETSLIEELKQEKHLRVTNLNHAIQLLRVTCITAEFIAAKVEDMEINKDIRALHNILASMRNAMECEVVNEINKLNSFNKGDKKILH